MITDRNFEGLWHTTIIEDTPERRLIIHSECHKEINRPSKAAKLVKERRRLYIPYFSPEVVKPVYD